MIYARRGYFFALTKDGQIITWGYIVDTFIENQLASVKNVEDVNCALEGVIYIKVKNYERWLELHEEVKPFMVL
jgi:hypothetical protein